MSIFNRIRSFGRARGLARDLRRCADALETIATGLRLVILKDYELDIAVPIPKQASKPLGDDAVRYVDDRQQATEERLEELERELRDAWLDPGTPNEQERALEELL